VRMLSHFALNTSARSRWLTGAWDRAAREDAPSSISLGGPLGLGNGPLVLSP
jgi:hypothetical protein